MPKARGSALLNKRTVSARAAAIILSVITALQLVIFLVGGVNKDGYHLDEIFSYGLSNSTTGAFLYDDIDKWVSGSAFGDYLTVQNDEKFSYDKVYENQVQDVHPPVYYVLLHTICSFFPDTFSKWFGLALNFLVFIFCQIVLYVLSNRLLKTRFNALLVCCIWGFSIGALNTFIFVRMYALLTLLILLITLIHQRILSGDKLTLKKMTPVVITCIIGGLTHYYFLVFLFFLAVCSCIFLLVRKRRMDILIYVGSMVIALTCIYLIFPAIVNHLSSGRGKQATSGFMSIRLIPEQLKTLVVFIYREMIGLPAAISLLIASAFVGIRFLFRRIRLNKTAEQGTGSKQDGTACQPSRVKRFFSEHMFLIGLLMTVCLYVWIIAAISPNMGDYLDRYIFCVFPVICIFLAVLLVKIRDQMQLGKKAGTAALLVVLTLFVTGSHLYPSAYLYNKSDEYVRLNEKVAGSDCLYVIPRDYEIHTLSDALMYSNRVYTAMSTDQAQIQRAVSGMDASKSNLLIITDRCLETEKLAILDTVEQLLDYEVIFLFKGLHGNDLFDVYKLEALK